MCALFAEVSSTAAASCSSDFVLCSGSNCGRLVGSERRKVLYVFNVNVCKKMSSYYFLRHDNIVIPYLLRLLVSDKEASNKNPLLPFLMDKERSHHFVRNMN